MLAAFLCDVLLGVFAALGWETWQVPPDYASRHYLMFDFPYSHGLLACMLWSLAAALVALWISGRKRAALVAAIALASHFFLDALVHVRGLPVSGRGSYKIGLALWNHLGVALALEVLMAVAALLLYFQGTRPSGRLGRYGMPVCVAFLTVLLVGGQATSTAVPGARGLILSWILAPLAFSALVFWLDRQRAART